MSAPVLVTGATGFLGHTLCPYLVERGYRVRAFVRPSSAYHFLQPLGIELAWGDIRDAGAIRTAIEGCRAVVHAAGMFRLWGSREEFFAINVEGTRNALEAALHAGAERFIYVSTIAVVGPPRTGTTVDERYPPAPRDNYQRSKLEAERLALRYHQEHGLATLVLRPGALYGPGGRYAFNRLFFEDPLKGLPMQVHQGRRIIFPLYVQDAAQSIELALRHGRAGEVYNVSGRSLSHREINDIVDGVLGYHIRRFNAPAGAMLALARVWTWLAHLTKREPYYPIDLASYVFHDWEISSEKARRELGLVLTPFEEGARRTLAWYQELGVGPSCWLTRQVARIARGKD